METRQPQPRTVDAERDGLTPEQLALERIEAELGQLRADLAKIKRTASRTKKELREHRLHRDVVVEHFADQIVVLDAKLTKLIERG